MRILLALLIALCSVAAQATPQHRDATGLWINPSESGWGLNLFHQGNTIFGSLFVYGPDGKARWYTASSLTGPDAGPSYNQASVYSGDLYESTGPGIGGAFDASRVTRRRVGSMTFDLGEGVNDRNWGHVVYDIDGVRVDKMVYPFAFSPMNLSGSYVGFRGQPGSPYCACPRMYEDITMTVNQSGSTVSMTMQVPGAGSCVYTGTYEANGALANIKGSYSCTNGSGAFSLLDLDLTSQGITSRQYESGRNMYDNVFGGLVAARTSGSFRGNGSKTYLWWDPGESGWGLNVIEQGDIIFGTLFVYDSEGRPRWYSASNLAYSPGAPPDAGSDSRGRYSGALFESTGPFFGTSFNPAAVDRRQVGTMMVEFFGDDTAYLDYNVGGVTVMRKALRRATLRANSLAGAYSGHITASGNDGGVQTGPMTMDVSDGSDGLTLVMRGLRGTCTMRAPRSQVTQNGHIVALSGDYDCGGARIGRMTLYDVEMNWSGFTGAVLLDGRALGKIDGLRTTMR